MLKKIIGVSLMVLAFVAFCLQMFYSNDLNRWNIEDDGLQPAQTIIARWAGLDRYNLCEKSPGHSWSCNKGVKFVLHGRMSTEGPVMAAWLIRTVSPLGEFFAWFALGCLGGWMLFGGRKKPD